MPVRFEISNNSFDYLLKKFISKGYDVVAPRKKESIHVFDSIESLSEASLDFINTTFPPKKYFITHREEIFSYGKDSLKPTLSKEKRIIFGVRPCDVNSFLNHEKVFLDRNYTDEHYKKKRENTLVFSLNCEEAGENCFCESMGTNVPKEGSCDLLLTKGENSFIVETFSKKGTDVINKNKKLFARTKKNPGLTVHCTKKLSEKNINKLNIHEKFNSEIWDKYAKLCLSCTSCTTTCPNCTCFGIRDITSLNLETGVRIREWQSCQLKAFTKVAGEYVFRDKRSKRHKHRIYHQLNYFKKRHGHHLCVGCGRCISNCPTKIDMTEILKEL